MVRRNKKSEPFLGNKLAHILCDSMGACTDAESLNNEVLIPFATALEKPAVKGVTYSTFMEKHQILFSQVIRMIQKKFT